MELVKKYEILLLDIDRTMLDFEKDMDKAFKLSIKKIGLEYKEEMLNIFKKYDTITWENYKAGKIKTHEEQKFIHTKLFFDEYGIDYDVLEFGVIT